MDPREKLIKLITNFYDGDSVCDTCQNDKSYGRCNKCISTHEADYLLANGVVVLSCRCKDCVYRDDPDVCPVFSVWTWDINDNFFCGFAERKGGELK